MRWRVSAWTHPGSGDFHLIDHSVPIISGTFSDPLEPRGRCSFSVPATYAWQDLINSDPVTPANNRAALIRVYRDGVDNTGQPDMEFYLDRYQRRILDDGTEVVQLSGEAWRVKGLDAAVVRWWDWAPGAALSRQKDWSYGGDDQQNKLRNLTFEGTGVTEKQKYHVHGGSGTYTLTVPTFGTTTNISVYEAGGRAVDVKAAIEDLPGITEVIVTGRGHTQNDPLVVEFKDPQQPYGQMTIDETNVVHAGCAHPPCHPAKIATIRNGSFDPSPWTEVADPRTGGNVPSLHGTYNDPGVSVVDDPDGVSAGSVLKIDGKTANSGVQQVIEESEPGFFANATVDVFSTSTTDEFFLRIVDRFENEIAITGPVTLAASTWTTVTIDQMVIPDPLPGLEIVFRVQVSSGDAAPADFYIKNPGFFYGVAAATIGEISTDLLADAQTDHAPTRDSIPWVTAGGYTATDDSATIPWPRDENVILRRGKHYGRDIYGRQFYELGYIHDLRPGQGAGAGETEPTADNWYLEIYHGDNYGSDLTGLAFIVSMGVKGGLVAGRVPAQTRMLGEGNEGIITEVSDATQEAIFGQWEEYFGDADLTDVNSLSAKAQTFLDRDLENTVAITVELDPGAPVPFDEFRRGDTAWFQAGGYYARHQRRITDITLTASTAEGGELDWIPSVTASKLLTGEHAINEGLYQLLVAHKRFPDDRVGGGGEGVGLPFAIPVIAAFDAPTWMQQGARWVCDGVSDSVIINEALQEVVGAGGGRVYMTPGTFNIDMTSFANDGPGIDIPASVQLIGAGKSATQIWLIDADTTSLTSPMVRLAGSSELQDVYVNSYGTGGQPGPVGVRMFGSYGAIRNCEIDTVFDAMSVEIESGDFCTIEYSIINGSQGDGIDAIQILELANYVTIAHNNINNGRNHIRVTGSSFTATEGRIIGNRFSTSDFVGIYLDGSLGGPFGWQIIGNTLDNQGAADTLPLSEAAIYVEGVAGEIIQGTSAEIGYGTVIVDNVIEAVFGHGIQLHNATGVTVADNYIEDVDGHGIFLSGDTDHSTVHDNRIFMSADAEGGNTWDMIHVDGSENLIHHNTTRDTEGIGGLSRYALALDGNDNIIDNNDFRFTGSSGTILDNGTGNDFYGQNNTWIDYTPTWTAVTTNPVLNNGTLTGRYKITEGNHLTGLIRLLVGSTTTFGTGAWEFDLPVAPAPAFDHVVGPVHIEDNGTGWETGAAFWNAVDSVLNVIPAAGGPTLADVNTPIAWATDDELTIHFSTEV